jgi:hypothetical protein
VRTRDADDPGARLNRGGKPIEIDLEPILERESDMRYVAAYGTRRPWSNALRALRIDRSRLAGRNNCSGSVNGRIGPEDAHGPRLRGVDEAMPHMGRHPGRVIDGHPVLHAVEFGIASPSMTMTLSSQLWVWMGIEAPGANSVMPLVSLEAPAVR